MHINKILEGVFMSTGLIYASYYLDISDVGLLGLAMVVGKSNNKDEGIWKKAFVDADGDESKQKALYMKYRSEEIINS